MGVLDDIANIFAGGGASSSSAAPPSIVPDYGAAPVAPRAGLPMQAPAPSGNVLARIKPPQPASPSGPLGIDTPIGGGNLAAALGGLAQVNPHSSRFGAFAQWLAGGMASQQQAQYRDAQLGLQAHSSSMENLLRALQIEQARRNFAGSDAAAAAGRDDGGVVASAAAPSASPALGGGANAGAPADLLPPAGGSGAVPAAPTSIPPGSPSPTALSPVSAPSQSSALPPLPAWADPRTIGARIDRLNRQGKAAEDAGSHSVADDFYKRAAQEQTRLTAMIHDHETMNSNNQIVNLPGSVDAATQRESAIATGRAQAEATVKDQHELLKVQRIPGGPIEYVPKSQVMGAATAVQGQPSQQPAAAPADGGGIGAGSPPGAGRSRKV